MSINVAGLVLEGEETLRELPMPAILFGVIALVLFLVLLGVTWMFRGTAAKLGGPHPSAHAQAPSGPVNTGGSGHH